MAGRVGFERAAGAARWALGSPRLTRLLAVHTALLLGAGMAVAGARSHGDPSSPAPVFQLAEAVAAQPPPPRTTPRAVSRALAGRPSPHPARSHIRPAPPAPKGWAYWAPRIRQCESSGNYRVRNSTTSASGAYQILDSTWQGRFGVKHAGDATSRQQDEAAAELYRTYGTSIWAASAPCWRA